MKILIATGIYPPDIGGPATYSRILFEELPKQGISVRVITYGVLKKFPWLIRQPIYFFKIFFAAPAADIIFAQDVLNSGISALISAKVWRKKFILKVVGDYAWEQGTQRFGVKEVLDEFLNKKYGWRVEFLRTVEKFVAGRADKIIVPSEYLKKIIMAWGIEPEKIAVIYNSFEPPSPAITKEAARKELELSLTEKIIVSAGRLVPWKGFGALREIMPEISKKFPGAKLFILNDEPKERLLLYLSAADVFVLNTSYEGLSHQILEAMAIGAPVVTTNIGGNSELIKDGESGYLVGFNDKIALKSKILEILGNAILSKQLAENAKLKAREFSKERMIDQTLKLIQVL